MNMLDEKLLTVGEVALRLCQSERTVRDKVAAGLIPSIRIGDGSHAPIRIRSAEFAAWLAARSNPPAEGDE